MQRLTVPDYGDYRLQYFLLIKLDAPFTTKSWTPLVNKAPQPLQEKRISLTRRSCITALTVGYATVATM